MTRLITILISAMLWLQNPGPSVTGAVANGAAPSSTYTYSQYAYVAETGGTAVASITSNSVSVSAGDFAFQFCRGYQNPTSVTGSSTPTATVNALPYLYWSTQSTYVQTFWYPSLSAGATTFTCTPASSEPYQGMAVIIYHHSGSGPAILSGSTTTGTCSTNFSCVSSSFSTSSAALVIDCATTGDNNSVWGGGSIGSNTGVIRGVSQSSLTTGADSGCEDTQFSTVQSSITATISSNTDTGGYAYTVAAFN